MTSTSASRASPTYGALSGQRPDQVEDQEPSPLKEDPRDFALWKATKEGEDTSWESPWGPGRPGWHIECSAMAEKTLGPEFWIHGGGLDLVFPHHENERAQSQAVGRPFAKIWMHNGLLRFTGEKMSKSVGNVATIQEVIAEWGREAALLFLHDRALAQAARVLAGGDGGRGVQVESLRNALRGETRATGDWGELAAVLDDDFNTPAALALFHRWAREGALVELRRGLAIFGLGVARRRGRGSGRGRRARARARARHARRATSPSRTACATRSPRQAGRCGTWPPSGFELVPAAVTRELVFGRNAVREALRGRREVLELWVSERAAASLDWLDEGPATPGRQGARADRGGRRAPITRASSRGQARIRTPIRGSSPRARQPLLACLDQVTDPRNLGAVIRSAAGAGATGVIVPAHGAAQVTPAVCRSSAGTVEHLPVAVVPNLARFLAEIKRDDLWSYAATADAPQTMWQADLTGGVALVFGAEGKGVRPLVRKTCDADGLDPARRRASSRSTSASRRRCCSTRRGASARDARRSASAGARSPLRWLSARADALPLRRLQPAPRRRHARTSASSTTSSRASSR